MRVLSGHHHSSRILRSSTAAAARHRRSPMHWAPAFQGKSYFYYTSFPSTKKTMQKNNNANTPQKRTTFTINHPAYETHGKVVKKTVIHTLTHNTPDQTITIQEKPCDHNKNYKLRLTENEKIIVLARQDMRCNMCTCRLVVHPCTKRKLFEFDHIE